MAKILNYYAHDPVGNNEGLLTVFDRQSLEAAEENGIVFIAEYDNGTRAIVKAVDIEEPDQSSAETSVTLIGPQYVDDRMKAVVAVFDSLAESTATATMALADGVDTENPTSTFAQALAALKAIVFGDAEGEE